MEPIIEMYRPRSVWQKLICLNFAVAYVLLAILMIWSATHMLYHPHHLPHQYLYASPGLRNIVIIIFYLGIGFVYWSDDDGARVIAFFAGILITVIALSGYHSSNLIIYFGCSHLAYSVFGGKKKREI